MKKTITYLLLSIIYCTAFSQDYFNNRYNFEFPWAFDGSINAMEVDGGYIVNGATGDSLNYLWNRIAIAKIDYEGNKLWSKTWGDTTSLYYFADRGSLIYANNAYYSTGSKAFYADTFPNLSNSYLIKYNDDFDTLWCNYFANVEYPYDTTTYVSRNFIYSDNAFVFSGNMQHEGYNRIKTLLIKTDTLGNKIWQKIFGDSTHYLLSKSVIETTDGGYAIGNYRWIIGAYGNSVGDPYIIKTDEEGDLEWELNIGGPYKDGSAILCNSPDGNIICATAYSADSQYYDQYLNTVMVLNIDNNGTILKQQQICEPVYNRYVTNIRPANNGYIITGYGFHYGFMLKIDYNLDSVWYRQYDVVTGLNMLYDAIQTSNGGFLGVGGCVPGSADTGTQDVWAIKVDSMGCTSPWDCWVRIDDNAEIKREIKVSPNPAHSYFTVDNVTGSNSQIKVFNLNGTLVYSSNCNSNEPHTIDVTNFPAGMYIIKIKSDSEVYSAKVVVR